MTRHVKPRRTSIADPGSATPFSPFSMTSLIKFQQNNSRSLVMRSDNSTHDLRVHEMKVAVAAALFTLLAAPPLQAGGSETGVWIDHTGRGAVEIAPCGDNHLCGRIVWLKEPNDKYGRPLTDGNNPRAAQRDRPICGLPILGNLQLQSNGAWDAGWVYDPNNGSTHDAQIELAGPDRLVLTGYKGLKLFSKSFTWVRAPEDMPRCDSTSTATANPPSGGAAKAGAGVSPKAKASSARKQAAPKQLATKPAPPKLTSKQLDR